MRRDSRRFIPLSDERMPTLQGKYKGNMFQFNRDFAKEFCGARDPKFSRSVNPKLQTFAQWLAANAPRIPTA